MCFPRTARRRSAVKKLRTHERVPAVIYGRRRAPQSLELRLEELEKLVHQSASENILVDLTVEGEGPTSDWPWCRRSSITRCGGHPARGLP
ncbi:MAG: hypothetical protein M5U12_01180 [Verrucomicrobia bacterium]|nr:hypothetical protein [Verrucomicrobiota bacterium]